ncbi:MAG: fimbrillin family protein [Alistipes sp.]
MATNCSLVQKSLLIGIVVMALFAGSCTKQVLPAEISEVQITPLITRVTGVYFDKNDQIGLTISKSSGVYIDNKPLIYNGTIFAAQGLIWYNNITEHASLSAYYPYQASGTPTLFTIASDQSGVGYAASDLLAATRTDVTPSATPVEMLFHHLMTKLSIQVVNTSDATIRTVTIDGAISSAQVDIPQLTAVVKPGAVASSIQAHTITAETLYEAIVVPQTTALTLTVATNDGKTHAYKLVSSPLLSGKLYIITFAFSNIDMTATLSGAISDWENGGALVGEGGGTNPGEGGASNTLSYGGVDYKTVTLNDGRTWMAENLRYIPAGKSASTDATVDHGIWYPCTVDGVASTNAAFVAQQGLLYDLDTAYGAPITTTNCNSVAGSQGICPNGWHLPTRAEFEALIAAYAPPYSALTDTHFFTFSGIRTAIGTTKQYHAPLSAGAFCSSYLTGSSTTSFASDQKFQPLLSTTTSGSLSLSMAALKTAYGLPIRCLQNQK